VYENLTNLADRLEINIDQLPKFLENLADIHLSVAYYQSCYNAVVKDYDQLSALVARLIHSDNVFKHNNELLMKYDHFEDAMWTANSFIQEQLKLFEVQTRDFWSNVSPGQFNEIEKRVKSNHVRIGGILCGIKVKMDTWCERFPSPETARPSRVAEFIMSELTEGIGNIYQTA